LNLHVDRGEILSILGPSGCGKTTTLRMIAGLEVPTSGSILANGRDITTVPARMRNMGMVFQNYAVWPHKTVYENVVFGLKVRKVPVREQRERVNRILDLVNLTGLEDRYPNQLSGGQQQRVALARSLVVEPRILLLDEPLSNLDAKLRERMRWELKALQRRTGITFVYVTHDQSEAMALSDRIAVMHQGHLEQYGTPRDVYARPATKTVADFMGLVNFVTGRVGEDDHGSHTVRIAGGHRIHCELPPGVREGQEVQVAVRPENVHLEHAAAADPGALCGTVTEAAYLGNLNDHQVTLSDGTRLRVQSHPLERFDVGQPVAVRFDAAQVVLFA
jgi:spermidine/putrescine ABC transporter ATP-binding subunit